MNFPNKAKKLAKNIYFAVKIAIMTELCVEAANGIDARN
ncbi:hypothetical protein HMPREF0868_0392 [Mageeibacillus indolicus UPII9-5]|uniref:Uncharacterized protein n=1 Tax=Mageeibacillus indolicus (strain UPII9-5) TaxID=699246 RepID=D3R0M3_MAGIU|nr:hypothetical protein HMPREF0868_0392 [Mageeibacillus indolicus UPII9-5]